MQVEKRGKRELGSREDTVAKRVPGAANAQQECEGYGWQPREYVVKKLFADQIYAILTTFTFSLPSTLSGCLCANGCFSLLLILRLSSHRGSFGYLPVTSGCGRGASRGSSGSGSGGGFFTSLQEILVVNGEKCDI
ncbi:hypothetical protein U1Q18_027910 [Sarracenia purpurea var. burkii]